MRKGITVLVMLLAAAMLVLPGCDVLGGGEELPEAPPATPASIPQLQSEINTLKTQVSSLSSQLAGISVPATDTSALEASIAVLQTQIAELTNRIAVLEAEEGGTSDGEGAGADEEPAPDDTTRWYLDAWADYSGTGLLDLCLDYPRIMDEDDYCIYVYLYNRHKKANYDIGKVSPDDPEDGDYWLHINGSVPVMMKYTESTWDEVDIDEVYTPITIDSLNLSFSPSKGDRVKVDKDNTFLGGYRSHDLDWETDISERTDGTCRSIRAESHKKFVLPVPTFYYTGKVIPMELKLLFELYYAS